MENVLKCLVSVSKMGKETGKMSVDRDASSFIAVSCPEKSIHHFHVFVSCLTLATVKSVGMITHRIDEVQVGGG